MPTDQKVGSSNLLPHGHRNNPGNAVFMRPPGFFICHTDSRIRYPKYTKLDIFRQNSVANSVANYLSQFCCNKKGRPFDIMPKDRPHRRKTATATDSILPLPFHSKHILIASIRLLIPVVPASSPSLHGAIQP